MAVFPKAAGRAVVVVASAMAVVTHMLDTVAHTSMEAAVTDLVAVAVVEALAVAMAAIYRIRTRDTCNVGSCQPDCYCTSSDSLRTSNHSHTRSCKELAEVLAMGSLAATEEAAASARSHSRTARRLQL